MGQHVSCGLGKKGDSSPLQVPDIESQHTNRPSADPKVSSGTSSDSHSGEEIIPNPAGSQSQLQSSLSEIQDEQPRDSSKTNVSSTSHEKKDEGKESAREEESKKDVAGKKSPLKEDTEKTKSCLRRTARRIFYYKYFFLIVQGVYMSLCWCAYVIAELCFKKREFFKGGKNKKAKVLADGVYFVAVSFTTVGFGDITPNGGGVKAVTSVFVLFGVVLMPMVNIVVNEWFDALDDCILNIFIHCFDKTKPANHSEETGEDAKGGKKGWSMAKFADYLNTTNVARKINIRTAMAGIYVLVCTGLGQLTLLIEHMKYQESLYTSITTQTTVGYGDIAFNSTLGRLVGSVWILLAAAVTSRFLDLLVQSYTHKSKGTLLLNEMTEADVNAGMRRMLQKDMSEAEINAAGITEGMSKAEIVMERLKALNLLDDDLIDSICDQSRCFKSGH